MTARSLPRRLTHGLGLPFRAAGLLARTPSLWPLALAPALLTALGLGLGLWLGWSGSERLLARLWHPDAPGWLGLAVRGLAHVALYLALVLIAALTPPLILAAPLNDTLSARVEALLLGTPAPPGGLRRFLRELLTSLFNALARLLRFGLVQALIALLALIPVVQLAYPFVAFLWSAMWLAEQVLDQTMARHLYRAAEVHRALRAVRPAGLAMGAVLAAVFLIPLANLFLVPLGVATGAVLYADLVGEGHLPALAEGDRPAP